MSWVQGGGYFKKVQMKDHLSRLVFAAFGRTHTQTHTHTHIHTGTHTYHTITRTHAHSRHREEYVDERRRFIKYRNQPSL